MEKELVIISDLWGKNNCDWIQFYRDCLPERFSLKFYDACELGEIDSSFNEEKNIHRHFIDFGIDKAARKLVDLENKSKIYLGYSVGGTILWKAGLVGLQMQKMIGVSATRLRKEKEKASDWHKLLELKLIILRMVVMKYIKKRNTYPLFLKVLISIDI